MLSFTAFSAQMITRSWMVQEMTGSPFLVSLIPVMMMLPMLFLSLAGGVLADRVDRRRIILTTEALALAGYAALFVLIAVGVAQVWHLLALSAVSGIGFAFAGPARMALVPSLVPPDQRRRAVALSAVVFSVAQIAGPALGGLLIARAGTEAALFATLVLMAPAWALYLSVRPASSRDETHATGSPISSVRTGIAYAFREPALRALLLGSLVVSLTLSTWPALLPTFTESVMGRGAAALGTLTVAMGFGSLVGSLVVAAMSDRVAHGRIEIATIAVMAVAVVVFAVSPWFGVAVVAATIAGMAQTGYFVANMTVVQMAVSDEFRGRVMSIRFLIFGFQPLGMLALGGLAEAIGVRGALLWYAVPGLGLFVAVYLLTRPKPAATSAADVSDRVGESASDLKAPQPTAPAVRILRR